MTLLEVWINCVLQVLYLLNDRGELLNRSKLYKIKPKDIEGSHAENFDLSVQKVSIYSRFYLMLVLSIRIDGAAGFAKMLSSWKSH